MASSRRSGSAFIATVLAVVAFSVEASTLTLASGVAEGDATIKASFTPATGSTSSETLSVVSSDPAAASVPSTITVDRGATAAFTVVTGSVNADTPVTIEIRRTVSALKYTVLAAAKLLVLAPPAIRGLSLSPTGLTAGGQVIASISLVRPAEHDGADIRISARSAAVSVPPLVTVPARSSSATFSITTSAVAANTTVTVTAVSGGSTATGSLTIRPAPALASVTLPTSIVSGDPPGSGEVRLAAAMSEPVVVSLQSSSSSLQVPMSVSVPAGFLGISFLVSGTGVSFGGAEVPAQLTASIPESSQTASTVIQPAPAPQILSLTPVTLRTINTPAGPRRLILRSEPMRITLSGAGAAKASVRETSQSAFASSATASIPSGATSVVATYIGPSSQFEGNRFGFVRIYNSTGAEIGNRSFDDLYFFDIRPVITASLAIDLVVLPGDGNVVIPGQRMFVDGTGFTPQQGVVTSDNFRPAVTLDGQQGQIVSSLPTRLEVTVPNVSNCFGSKELSVHNGVEPNTAQASPAQMIYLTVPCPEVTSVVPEALSRSVGTGSFVVRVRGDYLGKMNPTISVNGVNGTVIPVSQNEVEVLFPRTITSGAVVATTPYGSSNTAFGLGNALSVTD